MQQHDHSAAAMLRIVGLHTLQRLLRDAPKRPEMQPADKATLRCWLQPLLPAKAQNLPCAPGGINIEDPHDGGLRAPAPSSPWDDSRSRSTTSSHAAPQWDGEEPGSFGRPGGVSVLRERAAVMLLHTLAKLHQVKRGWNTMVEADEMRALLDALLSRLSTMTKSLDAQVCPPLERVCKCTLVQADAYCVPWLPLFGLGELCRLRLHGNDPVQAISNTLYAMAVLDRPDGRLIAGLTLAIERGDAALDAQQTANCLWALARLDADMPETMALLLQRLTTEHGGMLNAQDIANSMWALAKSQCLPQGALQVRQLCCSTPLGNGCGSGTVHSP